MKYIKFILVHVLLDVFFLVKLLQFQKKLNLVRKLCR